MTFHRAQTTLQKSLNKASNSGNISKTKMERHEKKKTKSEQNKHNIFKSFSKVIHAWGEKELEILQLEAAFPSWAGEARLRSACLPHPLSLSHSISSSFLAIIIIVITQFSREQNTSFLFSSSFFVSNGKQNAPNRNGNKQKSCNGLTDWGMAGWPFVIGQTSFSNSIQLDAAQRARWIKHTKSFFLFSLFSRPPINSDGSETKRESGGGNTKSTSKNFINFFRPNISLVKASNANRESESSQALPSKFDWFDGFWPCQRESEMADKPIITTTATAIIIVVIVIWELKLKQPSTILGQARPCDEQNKTHTQKSIKFKESTQKKQWRPNRISIFPPLISFAFIYLAWLSCSSFFPFCFCCCCCCCWWKINGIDCDWKCQLCFTSSQGKNKLSLSLARSLFL